MKLSYEAAKEFEKDLLTLKRRFSTLDEDLDTVKRIAIPLFHLRKKDIGGIFRIVEFQHEEVGIYKLKKFACRSLKGRGARSGIRVIYAFWHNSKKVVFIEMYFKGDKQMEDRRRIQKFFKETP